jgi:preprotein translocase subunit SecD
VKGFAFTLGLSTILDLLVVFLFTHPLVSLLSRMRSFGSARFTGLDSIRGKEDVVATAAPAQQRRRAGSRGSARPAATKRAVAVLEKDEATDRADRLDESEDTENTEDAADVDEVGRVGADDVDVDVDVDADADDETDGEPTDRRHTTPAAGSAAERAAARRARLRAEQEGEQK